MGRNKKETIQFNQTIPAGADYSGSTALSQPLRAPCTIQRVFAKFYPGQQGDLRVRPYLVMTSNRSEELITYPLGANRFLSGDSIDFDYVVDFDADNGYSIKLDVQNVSIYPYTLQISFEVDYVGGTARVL